VCWLAAWTPLVPALLVSLSALAVAAVTGAAGAWWLTRKLGGLTGDTYGALNEGVEALLLAAVIVYLGG
ncbi:adenosylcobinamide-GDP ribazoletransferase, partial [Paenibacillus sp. 598K]|uniref:adenosylcobinamide-GDP ribazoletransferase n=1 Tax=Paenibacillus sp. 598K TaxID=1117987 RepID=UPI0011D00FC4